MSSNLLGLPAENSSLRMTVFPVDFKVGITHPDRHSEFSSESPSFEKRLQLKFPSKKWNPSQQSQRQIPGQWNPRISLGFPQTQSQRDDIIIENMQTENRTPVGWHDFNWNFQSQFAVGLPRNRSCCSYLWLKNISNPKPSEKPHRTDAIHCVSSIIATELPFEEKTSIITAIQFQFPNLTAQRYRF